MRPAIAIASETTPPSARDVIVARSGADAHLRLAVLLAEKVGAAGDDKQEALAPTTRWPNRWQATKRCLERHGSSLTLVDIDSLWVEPPTGIGRFDDATSRAERAVVFDELLAIGADCGWRFIRPAPRAPVDDRLQSLALYLEHLSHRKPRIPAHGVLMTGYRPY